MSNVVREEIDNLNAVLTITLNKAEVENKLKAELNKYKDKAQMKGFRKGKTPESMLRKLYGKAILADIVNDSLQKDLYDHITQNKLEVLGQPLPTENHPEVELDPSEVNDYVFKFDLGISPEFEIKGLDSSSVYEKYAVEIPDARVEEELLRIRKRFGTRIVSESDIQEEDMLKVQLHELEGDSVKEGGIQHNFSILLENTAEETKATLLKYKVGDTLKLDVFELEKERDEAFVRRYFLGLDATDEREISDRVFQITIEEASRIEPVEMGEDFYNQYFGEGLVSNEEEAKEAIRKDYGEYFNKQAAALMFRSLQEKLIEDNPLPLPDTFLKRWILFSNENASAKNIEKTYDVFAKNLQWSLIRNKAARHFGIQVTEDDIKRYFVDRILSYFGGQLNDYSILGGMVERMMQDENEVDRAGDEVLLDKLQTAISEVVTIQPKPIAEEEFLAILRQVQVQTQLERAAESEILNQEEE